MSSRTTGETPTQRMVDPAFEEATGWKFGSSQEDTEVAEGQNQDFTQSRRGEWEEKDRKYNKKKCAKGLLWGWLRAGKEREEDIFLLIRKTVDV